MFASISLASRALGEPDCLDWIAMAQELGVPHTLNSAVQVVRRALEKSHEVERVTVLDTSHPDEVVIEVGAHLPDGQRFRVLVTVS